MNTSYIQNDEVSYYDKYLSLFINYENFLKYKK
jgi:hypothetical protein